MDYDRSQPMLMPGALLPLSNPLLARGVAFARVFATVLVVALLLSVGHTTLVFAQTCAAWGDKTFMQQTTPSQGQALLRAGEGMRGGHGVFGIRPVQEPTHADARCVVASQQSFARAECSFCQGFCNRLACERPLEPIPKVAEVLMRAGAKADSP